MPRTGKKTVDELVKRLLLISGLVLVVAASLGAVYYNLFLPQQEPIWGGPV